MKTQRRRDVESCTENKRRERDGIQRSESQRTLLSNCQMSSEWETSVDVAMTTVADLGVLVFVLTLTAFFTSATTSLFEFETFLLNEVVITEMYSSIISLAFVRASVMHERALHTEKWPVPLTIAWYRSYLETE